MKIILFFFLLSACLDVFGASFDRPEEEFMTPPQKERLDSEISVATPRLSGKFFQNSDEESVRLLAENLCSGRLNNTHPAIISDIDSITANERESRVDLVIKAFDKAKDQGDTQGLEVVLMSQFLAMSEECLQEFCRTGSWEREPQEIESE